MFRIILPDRPDPPLRNVEEAIASLPVNYRILAEMAVNPAEPDSDRADALAVLGGTGLRGAVYLLEQAAREEPASGIIPHTAAATLERIRSRPQQPASPEPYPALPGLHEVLGSLFSGRG